MSPREEIRRLRTQNQVLLQLALEQRKPVDDLHEALERITESVSDYLQVGRASVWFLDETRTQLRCMDLHVLGSQEHESGTLLNAADYPSYFHALAEGRVVDAEDAREDPRTREFCEEYLAPNDIFSMLDAPIFVGDENRGVVCLEALEAPRRWSEEDRTFAASTADLVSALLAAHERREAGEAIDALLTTASQAVLFVRPDGTLLRTNQAAEAMFGGTAEALRDLRFEELVDPDGDGAAIHAVLGNGGVLPRSEPILARRLDGSNFEAEVSVGRSRVRSKTVALVMLTDVSLRMENERRLREREELYRNVVEDQTHFVLRVAPGGRITFANRAACEYFGTTPEEATLRTVYDFSPAEDHSIIRATAAQLSVDDPVRQYEVRGNHPSGEVVTCSWTLRGLFDQDGELTGYQTIGRDITTERRQQALLRETQRMEALAVLAGGIAHDFNNLLTPILGYTELVAGRLEPDSKEALDLQRVLGAASRARELVRQVLIFSRLDEQRDRTPIRIAPYIKETLSFLRTSIPSRILVSIEVQEDSGVVRAAPSDIYQLLSNLCTNAYQAMPAGGQLSVSATRVRSEHYPSGEAAQIVVHDTGHGIKPAVRERVFEPFFTTKSTGDGTGLGLSVVHGLVNDLGGHVDVQSQEGSTSFVLYLPCVPETALPLVGLDPDGETKAWTGTERLLVVDDEREVSALVREELEPIGYSVDSRTSANDALAAFRNEPDRYDVLVTDFTMPYMTGTELALQVRRLRPDLPIVLMSGFADLMTELDLEVGRIDAFLRKPFRVEELAHSIRLAIDRRNPGTDGE